MKSVAEKIFYNGKIYSANENNDFYEAVVVSDHKIIFAGTEKEAKEYASEDTEMIDLQGKFMMPGAVDAHNHMPWGAITHMHEIDLLGVVGVDAILNTIKEFVEAHPENDYYLGAGYARTDFDAIGPRKEWLDEICPDKPMLITDLNGHSCWLNSKAFEDAGITKDTPNPEGGVFQKHPETGELTGSISEDSAIFYARRHLPKYTKEQYKEALLWAQEWFNQEGFTASYDASLMEEEPAIYEAYSELAEEGKMTMRFRAGWYINSTKTEEEADDFLDRCREKSATFTTPYFQVNNVKILRDGAVEEQTAYMLEPYTNLEPGYRGEPLVSKESFQMILEKLEERGLQVHIHEIGDAVAEEALEKFEELEEKYGPKDRRNVFAHCQHLTPDQLERMGKLKMGAVSNPNWATLSPDVHYDVYLPHIGEYKTTHIYQLNTLSKLGVPVGYHTDYPVSVPKISYTLYSGLTREIPKEQFDYYYEGTEYHQSHKKEFGKDLKASTPLPPYDEVLTMEQTIKLMTINGAWTMFMDKEIGTIEEGKYADMVVLSTNPFETPLEELEKIHPEMTVFDGNVVFKEGDIVE